MYDGAKLQSGGVKRDCISVLVLSTAPNLFRLRGRAPFCCTCYPTLEAGLDSGTLTLGRVPGLLNSLSLFDQEPGSQPLPPVTLMLVVQLHPLVSSLTGLSPCSPDRLM